MLLSPPVKCLEWYICMMKTIEIDANDIDREIWKEYVKKKENGKRIIEIGVGNILGVIIKRIEINYLRIKEKKDLNI